MKKTIAVLILSLISALSAVAFIGCRNDYKTSLNGHSEAKNIIFTENPSVSELNDSESTEFFVGQTFRAKKRVDFGGFVCDATAYITYPDGSRYRQNVITFDEEGIYVVRYEALNNGRPVYKDEKLTVKRRNFYFASDSYVRSFVKYGKDCSEYDTGHTGLTVKLYSGDTFYYDDVIDLRKTDGDDFIKMFALPEKIGYFDLERFTVRLTDAYDENNYVDIFVSAYPQRKPPEEVPQTPEERWKYNNTYLMAGANNQMPGGLEWTADGYKLVTRDITGFPAKHSMYGYAWFKNSVGKDLLNLGFDLTEKQLYSTNVIGGRSNLVIDLDDIAYMDVPWDGFTTGEVRMSIKGFLYRDNEVPFTFMITELGKNDVENAVVTDSVAPVISVGEDKAKKCYEGYKMPVPDASYYDESSKVVKKEVSVFYNYGSNTAYNVDIKDGFFIPEKEGKYTVEYKAWDSFGNLAKKLVTYNAIKGKPADFDVSLSVTETVAEAGRYHTLIAPELSGEYKTLDAYVLTNGIKEKINGNEYKFTESGEKTVLYELSNEYGQIKTASYKVRVSEGETVVFENDPVLPRYFISGFDYALDDLYATRYFAGGVSLIKAVHGIDFGDGYVYAKNGRYSVPQSATKASIRYTVKTEDGTVNSVYEVPIIDVKSQDGYEIEKYFVGENVETSATSETVDIKAKRYGVPTKFCFANYLNADNFSLTFAIDEARKNFSAIEYTLVDYKNPNVKIKVAFEKTASGTVMRINDEARVYSLQSGFENGRNVSLSYDNASCVLSTVDCSILLRTDLSGNKFTGFPSGIIYLDGEMKGVLGASVVKIGRLNQQNINDGSIDYTRPSIHLNGQYKKFYSFDGEVTICSAISCDVLDGNLTAYLTVLAPDGSVATATDGTLLSNVSADKEYKVKANLYGEYYISYASADSSNRKASYNLVVFVQDDVSPVIEGKGKTVTVKKNEKVEINALTVSDDKTAEPYAVRFLTTPSGDRIKLSADVRTLAFADEGVYEIRYYAVDENGNAESYFVRIKVSGEDGK